MVLVIIGLMSSAVVMTLPKDPPASRAVSDTLLKQFNQAAQESILSGAPAAFGASKSQYSFYSYDGFEWRVSSQRDWHDALSIELRKDGEDVKLTDTAVPLIIFEPTGNSSIYTLTLSDFNGRFVLSSKGDGRVILESGS